MVGTYGRRVQHCVRRRREAVEISASVRRTVVRIMARLRFLNDGAVDSIAISVGVLVVVSGSVLLVLVAVVDSVLGVSESRVVTAMEDNEVA